MAERDYAPKRNYDYATVEYWDQRFETEGHHEWLVSFRDVADLIREHVKPTDRILLIGAPQREEIALVACLTRAVYATGCGNSAFTADLYADGFTNLVSTDFSEVVIRAMRDRYIDDLEGVAWEVQDMRDLTHPPGSFDVVIDKAATDAILAAEGSVWDPEPAVVDDMDRTCRSVARVLRPGGKFVQITFQQPMFRKKYLEKDHLPWAVTYRDVDVGFGYFFFVCTLASEDGSGAGAEHS